MLLLVHASGNRLKHCIHLDGSYQMPEGLCLPESSSRADTWPSECDAHPPSLYCEH